MISWWNSLILAQQIFALIAIPSTIVILIQTVLLLIGLGDSGGDGSGDFTHDGTADIDHDAGGHGGTDDGLALFSVRGIMTMLAVAGWSGMALLETSLPSWLSITIAILLGVAMLFLMAYVMKLVSKLQSSGNIDVGNAIGKVAQVYIPIPPAGTGSGKVTLTLQETYTELNAITTASQTLKTGSYVRVVSVDDSGTLVVEPLSSASSEK
jgi:membrane protein implicated in regulation of membrane protease activity